MSGDKRRKAYILPNGYLAFKWRNENEYRVVKDTGQKIGADYLTSPHQRFATLKEAIDAAQRKAVSIKEES